VYKLAERFGRAVSGGVAAALLLPAALWFHAHLTHATPGVNETVAAAPARVRLWFSQRPDVKLSSVSLYGADSTRIPTSPATATDDSLSVAVAVKAPLGPGSYVVRWRTASKDGHPIKGQYRFTVAAPK
jgi:methionine-rich copper-binding protein CopC